MNSNSLPEMVNKIAKELKNETAVIFNDNKVNYSELNSQSDFIAKNIINRGISPGSIIALGLYNDIDLIPALLAIWKANCVYLPIDPNYPSKRIEMMLNNAKPKLLLTKRELHLNFPLFKGKTYFIDEKDNVPNLKLRMPKLGDLAYLMYTSGSTGTPKGIVVDHFALKHAAVAYNELHPEKCIALVAGSISFDPSLLTIVSTLTKGGTLCLYNNREGIDVSRPQEIVDLIDRNIVNFMLSTPSLYSKLIQQNKSLASLKTVDLCGEDISRNLIDSHQITSPNATLYNVYGPTEYAMGVTASVIYDPKEQKTSQVTIGKPFSHNKIYILDPHLNRVAPGEKGEIYVGGPGLAKGYFKQEKLTKEKFLLVDHLESYPIRVYRTGDLGCFLPSGEVVFMGRTDLQVKINGHRVELEEIESCISKYPHIEKVVVLLVKRESKNRLVAFFSTNGDVGYKQLNDFLLQELPPYMIPSTFVRINDWPLTNNGKINKTALESTL